MRMNTRAVVALLALIMVMIGRGPSSHSASAIDFGTGALQGTVLWGGSPISSLSADPPCVLKVSASGSTDVTAAATYYFPSLPANVSYGLAVKSSQNALLATGPSVTVAGGTTTTQDIDLTGSLGLVTGQVLVNGTPVANPYLDVNYAGLCEVGGADGSFALLLPPGTYGVAVRSGQGQCTLASFSFTVAQAGVTNALGAVAAQPLTGCPGASVQGQLLFNGAPFVPIGQSTAGCGARVRVDGADLQLAADGSFQGVVSAPNTNKQLTLSFGAGQIASRSVWLVDGVSTTADLDTTNGNYLVTGSITVNGTPLATGSIQITADGFESFGLVGCMPTDGNGNFNVIVYSGLAYTAHVYAADGSFVGTFHIPSANAGQTLTFGSVIAVTSTGSGVQVPLGSVSLTFNAVTGSGTSSVAVSNAGPIPPSGTNSGSVPVYYDVSTTATFTGSVNMCVDYDPATFAAGAPALLHWDGSAWVNVTTSLDETQHRVCGLVTSFSPFLVTVPQADTDGDGCKDLQEAGPNQKLGGQRSAANFWDYFDTPDNNNVRDHKIRVDDVTRVVNRYRANDGNGTATINRNSDPLAAPPAAPAYSPAFDRAGSSGPHVWNLTPPDGVINVFDVTAVVNQYRHDCA